MVTINSYRMKNNKNQKKFSILNTVYDLVTNPIYAFYAMLLFFIVEIFINIFIIWNIKYTEIDWKAYMQEVEGFLNGTYDYEQLRGDTGPLVYPAGFVYIFSILYYITESGVNVRLAQYIFLIFYQCVLITVFYVYYKTNKVPPYVFFFMCCASYRIHSIFVLRLFNDPVAMLLFYFSLCLMLIDRWSLACLFYSLAVSVKMNILLFAPALLLLLFARFGPIRTCLNLIICALVQLLIGAPFLLVNPMGYMQSSFELGRQFLFEWTVNWRFIEETFFLDRRFHAILLILHTGSILFFASYFWIGKLGTFSQLISRTKDVAFKLDPNDIVSALFTCNFLGMCFSRSLHYQFYVWYFHTLPYLLWSTDLPIIIRLLIMGVIEMCWNRYPSTTYSSLALHVCHLIILFALIFKSQKIRYRDIIDDDDDNSNVAWNNKEIACEKMD